MIRPLEILLTARIGDFPLGRSVLPPLLGLAVPLAVVGAGEGGGLAIRLALVLGVTLFWQMLFSRVRGRALGLEGLVTAALIALLVPPAAPLWQLVLGTSFGVVIGEQVFGGRGRNFLSPAVVALTFLMFSFTGEGYREGPDIPVWTLVPALLLMLGAGQASWRLLLAAAGVLVLMGWAQGAEAAETPWAILGHGGIVLALIFLAADPVAAAATNWGRIAHGALIGLMAGLFVQAGAAFGAVLFSILLASIFAPLIDQGAIALHMRWREGRHG